MGICGIMISNSLSNIDMTKINYENKGQPISIEVRNSLVHCCLVEGEVDENPWYYDIKQFIQH
jgi:hypothetical protein